MLPIERRDLLGAARLLRAELVAREEQEAEAARFVLAPERDEPGHLPNISQASDVDDEDHLACEDVERDVLSRVGPGAQIRERGHPGGSRREANTALGREGKQPVKSRKRDTRAVTRLTHSVAPYTELGPRAKPYREGAAIRATPTPQGGKPPERSLS